jgi:hypothetical protein
MSAFVLAGRRVGEIYACGPVPAMTVSEFEAEIRAARQPAVQAGGHPFPSLHRARGSVVPVDRLRERMRRIGSLEDQDEPSDSDLANLAHACTRGQDTHAGEVGVRLAF